jgi:hypothetical protein
MFAKVSGSVCAACHDDAGMGAFTPRPPYRLARLPDCFRRDGAAVDDHQVILIARHFADRLTLGDVEAAPQGDDLRPAHLQKRAQSASPSKT